MADVFSAKKRSWVMSRITSKNTSPETEVFKFLRKNKVHFQKHYKGAPGKPDIAIPRKKIAVMIDGDFWHGRRFRTWKEKMPSEYWVTKIENNIRRDKKNLAALKKNGWHVLRVWEYDLKTEKRRKETLAKILKFITGN